MLFEYILCSRVNKEYELLIICKIKVLSSSLTKNIQKITAANDPKESVANFNAVSLSGILVRSMIIKIDFLVGISNSYQLHS